MVYNKSFFKLCVCVMLGFSIQCKSDELYRAYFYEKNKWLEYCIREKNNFNTFIYLKNKYNYINKYKYNNEKYINLIIKNQSIETPKNLKNIEILTDDDNYLLVKAHSNNKQSYMIYEVIKKTKNKIAWDENNEDVEQLKNLTKYIFGDYFDSDYMSAISMRYEPSDIACKDQTKDKDFKILTLMKSKIASYGNWMNDSSYYSVRDNILGHIEVRDNKDSVYIRIKYMEGENEIRISYKTTKIEEKVDAEWRYLLDKYAG